MKTFAETNTVRQDRPALGSTDISAEDFGVAVSEQLESCEVDVFEQVPHWVKPPTVDQSTIQNHPNIIRKFLPGLLSHRNPRHRHMRKDDYLLLQQEIAKAENECRRVGFVLKTKHNNGIRIESHGLTIPTEIGDRINEIKDTELWKEATTTEEKDSNETTIENWSLVYSIKENGDIEDVTIKVSVAHELGNRPTDI